MTYEDIQKNNKLYDAVEFLSKNNFMKGYLDGMFHPERDITLTEFYALICRVFFDCHDAGCDKDKYPEIYCKIEHSWAKGYIIYLIEKGVIEPKDLDSLVEKFESPVNMHDVYELLNSIKRTKELLVIPDLKRRSTTNKATRLEVAKLVYSICKETGSGVSKKVIELNGESRWEQSIELLYDYICCLQFVDADVAYIFNLIYKNKEHNKICYEYMIQILNCKKHFPRTESGTIYHYTNMYALEKLTQPNAKFRLSNVAYLNDPMEGRLLVNRVKNCFKEKELLEWKFLSKEYDELAIRNSFVISFNKQDDELLPMWVQYGDGANGCMLGVNANSISVPLYEVVYDEGKIDRYVNDVKGVLISYLKMRDSININEDIVFLYATETLTQSSYLYKDKYYEHEKEVRILLFASLDFAKIAETVKEGEFFPRLFIELDDDVQFDSITIGTKAAGIEKTAVALSQRGYTNIYKSKIQFR